MDTVSALGLGTAALTLPYGPPGGERRPPERAEAARTIAAALEAGIGLIDTAPAYGDAEALVGEVAAGAECAVATKLAVPPGGWDALDDAAVDAAVRASAEASVAALRRERLDLLQVHNATPRLAERVIGPLRDVQAAGLAGAVGATVYGEEAALAVIASGFDAVQIAYSALDRRPERAVLPAAVAAGTTVIARSALLRGVLSDAGRSLDGGFGPLRDAADDLRRAAGVGWNGLAGTAVAYVRARPEIASVLLGPRDAAELRALLAGGPLPPPGWWVDVPDELLDPTHWPPA